MRFFVILEKTVNALSGVFLAFVFVLVTVQIASRYVLDFSLAAASELAIYSAIWSVLLGAATAFRHNGHIAMTIFRDALPRAWVTTAQTLSFVLVAGFLLLITVEGYDLAQRAMRQLSSASRLPVGYVTMALPVGSVLALIFLCEITFREFRKGWPQ